MEARMIQARSIGKRAWQTLRRPHSEGRVLASFDRVCDLLTGDGDVIALAWDGVKNGPLNILLDNQPGAALPAGTRFVVSGTRLRFLIDPVFQIDIASAPPWDACPDWRALAARRERVVAQAALIAALLEAEAPEASLASSDRLQPTAPNEFGAWYEKSVESELDGSAALAHLPVAARAMRDLQGAHAFNDPPALRDAAARLCGLGPGLTPAGDDWLAGWLLGLRLNDDGRQVEGIGEAILAIARERTTVLSRAFLACAGSGEVDEDWMDLLTALSGGTEIQVAAATRSILAHGATSGADMLAGFVTALLGISLPPDVDQAKADHDGIVCPAHEVFV